MSKERDELRSGDLQDIQKELFAAQNELKKTKMLLEQEKNRMKAFVEVTGDTLFEYEISSDCMSFTKCFFGEEKEKIDFPRYTAEVVDSIFIHKDDYEVFREFAKALREGKSEVSAEFRNLMEDNQFHWMDVKGHTIYDENGKPLRVIGSANDIDERKLREEQLRISSEQDSLTGLKNHQVIINKIAKRIEKKKYKSSDWLIMIDVDDFKQINDRNGHLVGDAVLCMVADELRIAFSDSMIGRIGGDEFIIYNEGTKKEELEKKLVQINTTISEVYKNRNQDMLVSLSLGVVEVNGVCREFKKLFQCADYALYKVKRENKHDFYIMNAEYALNAPSIGYLSREIDEYVREETIIHNSDELVLFTLELLDNVSDMESGLKMVSDRICSFYNVDDIAYVSHDGDKIRILYHWCRSLKKKYEVESYHNSNPNWKAVWNHFDNKGIQVLRKEQMKKLPLLKTTSMLAVRPERMNNNQECIVFGDREDDRDWQEEKDGLAKMASILFIHLQQLYNSQKEQSEIDFRVNYDTVTGLPQYHKFISLSEQYMAEYPDNHYFFVYSDFTNFQYVNEVYGYTEGDYILKAFGEHLKKQENGVYFTRVNSDYFVSMFTGSDAESVQKGVLAITEEFCREMNQKYELCNIVMVSGMSEVYSGDETASWAIDRANIARKYNKDVATTVVSLYNQQIKEEDEAEKAIIANMASALENGEFHAWLQPKVSLQTGKIVGAEALVRWLRSDGTIFYPDSFIPIFEKNGFITEIDFTVLNQVLEYLKSALDAKEEIVPISVNFSRRHNERNDFVDTILKKMELMNVPSNLIEAEVTESVFMMDLSKLTKNLKGLKNHGIMISIDDFGSGYSSLNVLADMDADIIKLDKKFLKYTKEDSKAPVFIKYLVGMIKQMGYQVLAEGVETEEQMKLLIDANCDMVQGYYYAEPMPIPAFRKYLKEFNQSK